jgi:RsmI C-terminal HTH domain
VAELVEAGASRRTAAEVVARLTGVSRNELYRGSL